MALVLPAGVAEQARDQFGLLTFAQAREALTRWQVERLVAAGVLVRVQRGVYRTAGTPGSWRQRALSACLSVGGDVSLSHLAAAYTWRADPVAAPRIELTVPRWRHPRRDVLVHRAPLPAGDVAWRWRIPVTTPARTLVDLSVVVRGPLLQRIADSMLRRRQLSIAGLRDRLAADDPLPRHHRSALEAIIVCRAHGVGDSPPEDRIIEVLAAAGLPLPERHYQVVVGDRIYELDWAYPEWKIGIDYDGWTAHGDVGHFHGDRDRLADLQLAGWLLFQVTAQWSDDMLVTRVAEALTLRQG